MTKGGCLCGSVVFEITGTPIRMNICHCSMCRKISGSAYGVFAHIESSKFAWLSGETKLSHYESSPGHVRTFCMNCGSNVPNSNGGYTCIPAGCFDDDPGIKPELQIFAESKAPWHHLDNDIPSFDEFDPD